MLVRSYRLTDKVGIALLKCSVAVANTALESVHLLVSTSARGGGGILSLLLMIVLGFSNLILRILRTLWGVIKQFGAVAFGLGSSVAVASGRVTNRATRVATRSTSSAASNTMARRAARAELEATLIEDPLRSQNRLLSALFVMVLAILVGVVLWATSNIGRPTSNSNTPLDIGALFDSGADNLTPVATVDGLSVDIPTPVPTAQQLSGVLEEGGSLAFVARERGQDDIWVATVGSQAPLRLTNDPADDRDPAWSPDGTQLAYASRREGNWDIYIQDMNAVGSTEPRRMTFGLGFQAGPEWSPDGAFIAYESYQGNNLDIYVMSADGSEAGLPLPLSSEFPEYSPAWSPDPARGRQIAYVSTQDGNQEIYIYNLSTSEVTNVTNTPTIHEDYPAWSPDERYLAYSAVEGGIETVFIKDLENPSQPPQRFRQGRMPYWSPSGNSIIYAVDTFDGGTRFLVAPFTQDSVVSDITSIAFPSRNAVWTSTPLSPSFVNSGGLETGVPEPLYIEQVAPPQGDPPYNLGNIVSVDAPNPSMNERVNDSFNALREHVLQVTGRDFFGTLEHVFWGLDYRPQAGEDNPNWHMTGRAFSFNRNLILGFPAEVEVVREDTDLRTYWRVYVRVDENAQQGELGEPLRHFPWEFPNPNQGDVEAFDAGGRLQSTMPVGYYVDLTQIVEDFDWERVPAGNDWRANVLARNYWMFNRPDGLTIYDALRELYLESQLGGYVPTATPPPPATLEPEDDGAG